MKTVEITEHNFEATLEGGSESGIVLLDFWAPWCAPCRAFAPVYEAAAAKHPDVVFGKVDTEQERSLAGAFNIRAIPTLMVLRDGILLLNQAGMLPPAVLDDVIGKVRALDMGAVRARLAETTKGAVSA